MNPFQSNETKRAQFIESYIFDEDTGSLEMLPGNGLWNYDRPNMILVDHDFCQLA